MIVLSFDTSLAACSAAIVDVGERQHVLACAYCEPGKGHAEILLEMISGVMAEAKLGFGDIKCQVITLGPGSFTGVRVALSAARGFRIAHNIPICGVTTLQAISANIAQLTQPACRSSTAVIVDARRNEAYVQVFDADSNPLCDPTLLRVDQLDDWLTPWKAEPLNLIGTGVKLLTAGSRPLPDCWLAREEYSLPDAANFARLLKEVDMDDAPPEPLYLRKPDAKPQTIGQSHVANGK